MLDLFLTVLEAGGLRLPGLVVGLWPGPAHLQTSTLNPPIVERAGFSQAVLMRVLMRAPPS